jgi:hypothetical protein
MLCLLQPYLLPLRAHLHAARLSYRQPVTLPLFGQWQCHPGDPCSTRDAASSATQNRPGAGAAAAAAVLKSLPATPWLLLPPPPLVLQPLL